MTVMDGGDADPRGDEPVSVLNPSYGGCAWPLDLGCNAEEWQSFDPDTMERATALASSTLVRLTAHRVSNCPITVRPCRPEPLEPILGGDYWRSAFTPINVGGVWSNVCFGPGMACAPCEVPLPPPVMRVSEVKVDGAVVSDTDYRVHNARYLVWTGEGDCPWPATQDLSKPDSEPGTFSVTYLNAYPVDALGAFAAGQLALEFARACSGGSCGLPNNVTQVVRQGVSFTLETGAFPNGMTGIREVDAFIGLWNPHNRSHGATVWSPSMSRTRSIR
jgi:hypothetical protein